VPLAARIARSGSSGWPTSGLVHAVLPGDPYATFPPPAHPTATLDPAPVEAAGSLARVSEGMSSLRDATPVGTDSGLEALPESPDAEGSGDESVAPPLAEPPYRLGPHPTPVALVFRDGTELRLADRSASAQALSEIATFLAQRD
jgi:hypothetical protein